LPQDQKTSTKVLIKSVSLTIANYQVWLPKDCMIFWT